MRIDAKLHADNVQLAAKLGASVQIGGGKGGVQSDWAQNDAAAADYVRNRPGGYYGDPVETEVEVFSGELIGGNIKDPPFTIVVGNIYRVAIDGVTQEYTAFADEVYGVSCVTIGTAAFAEAEESENAWAITYAELTQGDVTERAAMIVATGEFDGKQATIYCTQTTRPVHKIPLALLETPPEKEQLFVVTPTGQYKETTYYSSATYKEIQKAVQDGLTVQLRFGQRYYELSSMDGEWAYFHGFYQYALLTASVESRYIHLYDEYNIGKNELTYEVTSTYTALNDLNAFDQTFSAVRTRMKFFITIRLLTTTAGAYVQMRYYKGTKTLNLCKHEDIGTNKVILYGELERTSANDTTFITTLRLLNEDGTLHASGFYYCGELDLASDKSYGGPKIEILSGTEDKFASRQNVKKYYR